jgi:serine/threonine-protein kinase
VQAKLRRATLGEFEIHGEIGRGGMAAVYLAHEVALNRKVAIKVMSPALLMGQGMAERFRQEAITVANLTHQHIITIHAVRQYEDLQYFVMQFVEGCSLETIIKQTGPVDPEAIQAMLYHVGGALAHAHGQGVIHRDIKPGNILVGTGGQAFVTDFGIAKLMESPGNTQTGTVVGTPAYMSPEQCRSTSVTWSSDQYSLGIVAYEMATGAAPFEGTTLSVIHAQVHDPVPPILEQRPDFPPEMAEAIHRMLAKTPEERFPAMAEALQALGAAPLFPGAPVFRDIGALVADHRDQASMPTTPVSPAFSPSVSGAETVVSGSSSAAVEATTTPVPVPPRSPVPRTTGEEDTVAVTTPSGPAIVTSPRTSRRRPWRWVAGIVILAAAGTGARFAMMRTAADQPIVSITSLSLAPDQSTLTLGDTGILIPEVLDTAGAPVVGAPLRWASGDEAVVRVTPQGAVVAMGVGTTFVAVDAGELSDTSHIVVTAQAETVASVFINRVERPLRPGRELTLHATVRGASGASLGGRTVRWTSSNPGIVSVDPETGAMVAIKPGDVDVSAAVEGQVGILPVSVRRATVASVRARPGSLSLEEGQSETVRASGHDASGKTLDRPIVWESADPSVVRVDAGGRVTALAPGTTAVVATIDGVTRRVPVTVAGPAAPAQVASGIRASLPVSFLAPDARTEAAAAVLDQLGGVMDLPVAWVSSDPAVVSITEDGAVVARGPGTAWLLASAGSLRDSVQVTVGLSDGEQFQRAVAWILTTMARHDTDPLKPLLATEDKDAGKRARKLLDRVGSGQWDLKVDTLPKGVSSRVDGDVAVVSFTSELRWKNAFGGNKSENVTFEAHLRRDGADWRLVGLATAEWTKL